MLGCRILARSSTQIHQFVLPLKGFPLKPLFRVGRSFSAPAITVVCVAFLRLAVSLKESVGGSATAPPVRSWPGRSRSCSPQLRSVQSAVFEQKDPSYHGMKELASVQGVVQAHQCLTQLPTVESVSVGRETLAVSLRCPSTPSARGQSVAAL